MKSLYLAVLLLAATAAPTLAQCEIPEARRTEAISLARLVNAVIANERRPRADRYPAWEELGNLPGVIARRGMSGPMGDLTRRVQWGSDEPLPGWRMHYVSGAHGYAFSLTDIMGGCGYTIMSDDRGVVVEGSPLVQREGYVPLTQ